jgi:hypothetical protein
MALTSAQRIATARHWCDKAFVQSAGTATFNHDDIVAAAMAIDSAFDATLSAAVAATSGSTTIIQALAASIPAPFSSASAAQKTLLACHILMKRAGLI